MHFRAWRPYRKCGGAKCMTGSSFQSVSNPARRDVLLHVPKFESTLTDEWDVRKHIPPS